MWRNALGARNLSEGLVTAALWGSALLGLLISLVGLYGPRELLLRGSNSFTDWVAGLGARYNLGDVLGGGDVGSGVFLLNLALAGISQVSGVDVGFLQLWSLCYFYALPSCAVAAAHIFAPSCRPGVLDVGITFHSTPTLLLEAAASLPAVAYMTFWLGARIGNSQYRAVGYLYVLLVGAPVFRPVLLQDSVALLKFRHFVEQQLRLPLLLPRILDLYSYFFSHWINAARVSPADKTVSIWIATHPSCVADYRLALLLVKACVVLPCLALGLSYSAGWDWPRARPWAGAGAGAAGGGGGGRGRRLI